MITGREEQRVASSTRSRKSGLVYALGMNCPDCGAASLRDRIAHAGSCPVGKGIDAIAAQDREWFAAHPGASERRREPCWAEGIDLKVMGYMPDVPGEWAGEVVVQQLQPGVRARRFDEVFFIPELGPQVRGPAPRVAGTVPSLGGLRGYQPPSGDVPVEMAQVADWAIDNGTWQEMEWEGDRLIVVSESYLAGVAAVEGKTWEEATGDAWVLERHDGHRAFVWRMPREGGAFGVGAKFG